MQFENKIYCYIDTIRTITVDKLVRKGVFYTISIVRTSNNKIFELMIFLGKEGDNYEVRIYKNKPTDKYVPHNSDNVKYYEENEEYATFIFEKYNDARYFIEMLKYTHNEYYKRPERLID